MAADEDPTPGEVVELAARRTEFLERLTDGPLATRDIVDALECSRSTVGRAVRELEAAGLVERTGEGYTTTLAGRIAAEAYREYVASVTEVSEARELLAPLPPDAPIGRDAIAGATVERLDGPEARVSDHLGAIDRADRCRALLPAAGERYLERLLSRAAEAGTTTEVVVPEAVVDRLREGTGPPERVRRAVRTDDVEVVAADPPSFGLFLLDGIGTGTETDTGAGTGTGESGGPVADVDTDADGDGEDGATAFAVVVFDRDGPRGVVRNDTPRAVRWAERCYRQARRSGRTTTGELTGGDGTATNRAWDRNGADPAGGPASGGLPPVLERQGFVELTPSYFERREPLPPATAWQAGVDFPEVEAGQVIEREAPGDRWITGSDGDRSGDDRGDPDPEGRSLTDALIERLAGGSDCALVGPPGSGKSTVCKRVAHRWYESGRGPVLYRDGGDRAFDATAALREALRRRTAAPRDGNGSGHALVVVEDAVRSEASAVFEVLESFRGDPSVSFLFDARVAEWRDPPGFPIDARLAALRREAVETVRMPPFDERTGRRFVAAFEEAVDDVDVDSGAVLPDAGTGEDAAVGDGATRPDPLLRLLHRLALRAAPTAGEDRTPTTLVEDVQRTYERFASDGATLDVAVLVALCTLAGIDVRPAYARALAGTDREREALDRAAIRTALDRLDGRMTFGRVDDPGSGGEVLRTVHEHWAALFLDHLQGADPDASERVTRVVRALLAPGGTAGVAGRPGPGPGPDTGSSGGDDREWIDRTARRLFGVLEEYHGLAPLFADDGGDPDAGTVLPASVASDTRIECRLLRARALLRDRRFDRALAAFDALAAAGEATGHLAECDRGRARVALERGEFERARERYRQAIERYREAGDRAGEADCLNGLGEADAREGRYDAAVDYHERARAVHEERNDPKGVADVHVHLGTVADARGNLETARDHYGRALELYRRAGTATRAEVAGAHNDLGVVHKRLGEYDDAAAHLREAIGRYRAVGDRNGLAAAFNNLGEVARKRGEDDDAATCYRRSLNYNRATEDDRGIANNLTNLGLIAEERDEAETAVEYHRQALALRREAGDRRGVAESLHNLGCAERTREEYGPARRRFEESLERFRELGDRYGEAATLAELGELARETGDREAAADRLRAAVDAHREVGTLHEALAAARSLVDLHEGYDPGAAAGWCEEAAAVAAAAGLQEDRAALRERCETLEEAA